jgi:hypothetical protein
MNLTPTEIAEDTLSKALRVLAEAVEMRLQKDLASHDLHLQLRLAHEDRAELAERLDHSLSEIKRIEGTSREVSVRIDNAMETIRGVMKTQGAA